MTGWKADVLLEGSWRAACSVLLTRGRESILVDTGMPHDAARLIAALASRGLDPDDIQCVINTHFHLDHVSNNFLFPRSIIYATQESHDWSIELYQALAGGENWKDHTLRYYPETFDYPDAGELMEKIRKIALRWWDVERIGARAQFRWMESHSLPAEIEVLLTSGHVPGHASLLIPNGTGHTVIAGDALLTRTYDARVLTMIPCCRAQYLEDRQTILSRPGTIIPGHDHPFQNEPSDPKRVSPCRVSES